MIDFSIDFESERKGTFLIIIALRNNEKRCRKYEELELLLNFKLYYIEHSMKNRMRNEEKYLNILLN